MELVDKSKNIRVEKIEEITFVNEDGRKCFEGKTIFVNEDGCKYLVDDGDVENYVKLLYREPEKISLVMQRIKESV